MTNNPSQLMQPNDAFRKASPVRDSKGRLGHTTGTTRPCRLGCPTRRTGVRWPTGGGRSRITWPCANDLHLQSTYFELRKPRLGQIRVRMDSKGTTGWDLEWTGSLVEYLRVNRRSVPVEELRAVRSLHVGQSVELGGGAGTLWRITREA